MNSSVPSVSNFESVEDEIAYLTNVKTQQHLSHAQARGIIPLFNYYFRTKDSKGRTKRLPKQEKDTRWRHYKTKVYKQYNRLVKGTFNSEAALIKRYSDPISFLKYRLKRVRDLNVTDLSETDQDYYREIGGLSDVEMTMYKQANIDSISKSADIAANGIQIGEPPEWKRRRISDEHDNNSNSKEEQSQHNVLDLTSPRFFAPRLYSEKNIPSLTQQPKSENLPLDHALNKLSKNLTEYEEEQIQKKKELAVLLTNEKTKAYMSMYALKLSTHPELLGLLPSSSLEDQLTAGIDL